MRGNLLFGITVYGMERKQHWADTRSRERVPFSKKTFIMAQIL